MYIVCLIISNYTRKEGMCNKIIYVHTSGCRQNTLNFEWQRNPFMQQDKQYWSLRGHAVFACQTGTDKHAGIYANDKIYF